MFHIYIDILYHILRNYANLRPLISLYYLSLVDVPNRPYPLPRLLQVVCRAYGLQNPINERLASAVTDAVSLQNSSQRCPSVSYDRVAVAYVQDFGLKAIAPLLI